MDEAESSTAFVDAFAEAKQQIRAAQKALEIRTLQLVEDRQGGTKFQPWLEKMGWSTYLHGLDRYKLMDLVKTPDVLEVPLVDIVWKAMEEMLQHSQQMVKECAGYFLRIEVVRNEVEQNKYNPLQAYMDSHAFKGYARPWKQRSWLFSSAPGPPSRKTHSKCQRTSFEGRSKRVSRT